VGLTLLPAVDVANGRAVRPVQGGLGEGGETVDPLEAALAWQDAGAEWIHLVDLDLAFGTGSNADLLATVVERLDIRVQLSGGIRDAASLGTALSSGCDRVVLATDALTDLAWCASAIADHGDRLAVALDVKGARLEARGSATAAGELFRVLEHLNVEGCARYVVTDVQTDGMLSGPNLRLLREVCQATNRPVVASGGVGSLVDLEALIGLTTEGLEAVIVGAALYEGRFTLHEALQVVEVVEAPPDVRSD